MTFKFSRKEFDALYEILKAAVQLGHEETPHSEDRAINKMIYALIYKTYTTFHSKIVQIKDKYSITMSEEQCIAFWLQFKDNGFPIFSYEATVIRNLITIIDQSILCKSSGPPERPLTHFDKCLLGIQ